MNPILRIRPLRATKPLTSIYRTTPFSRRYAHSSYGAEGEGEDQPPKDKKDDSPTRNIEHPGPPPPNVSQSSDSKSNSPTSSFSPEITRQPSPKNTETEDLPLHTRPSNDAHPTLTDGRPSPLMDDEGNVKDDVPKDVKQHNEDMQERHDRSFNQIADEGTLHKGFGSGKK